MPQVWVWLPHFCIAQERLAHIVSGLRGQDIPAFSALEFFLRRAREVHYAVDDLALKAWASMLQGNFPWVVYAPIPEQQWQEFKEQGYTWAYRVAPVRLQADMTRLVLAKDLSSSLSDVRSESLVDKINAAFQRPTSEQDWLLRCYQDQMILFSRYQLPFFAPPPLAIGSAVTEMPETPNQHAQAWSYCLNEIQMLMHQWAQSGTVDWGGGNDFANSLWLWGETPLKPSMPDRQTFFHEFEQLYADNSGLSVLAQELTDKAQKTIAPLTDFFARPLIDGNQLILLGQFVHNACGQDNRHKISDNEILSSLLALEEQFFQPFLQKIQQLSVKKRRQIRLLFYNQRRIFYIDLNKWALLVSRKKMHQLIPLLAC